MSVLGTKVIPVFSAAAVNAFKNNFYLFIGWIIIGDGHLRGTDTYTLWLCGFSTAELTGFAAFVSAWPSTFLLSSSPR